MNKKFMSLIMNLHWIFIPSFITISVIAQWCLEGETKVPSRTNWYKNRVWCFPNISSRSRSKAAERKIPLKHISQHVVKYISSKVWLWLNFRKLQKNDINKYLQQDNKNYTYERSPKFSWKMLVMNKLCIDFKITLHQSKFLLLPSFHKHFEMPVF